MERLQVPQFRPRAALRLLDNLVSGRPFAAPLLSDEELGKMSDGEFDDWLDAWTVKGKNDVAASSL